MAAQLAGGRCCPPQGLDSSILLYMILFHYPMHAEKHRHSTHKHRQTSIYTKNIEVHGGGYAGKSIERRHRHKKSCCCCLCKLADAASSLPD